MEYLVIGCLVILIIVSIIRKKYLLTPVSFFSGIWVFVIVLTSLKLYGMTGYSDKALWLVLLCNSAFFIGTLSNKIINFRHKLRNNSSLYEESYSINMPMIYGCMLVTILCLFVFGLKVVKLLREGVQYYVIRDMLFGYGEGDKIIENGIFMNFFQWIIVGIVNALLPICLIELFEQNKHKIMIAIGLSIAILYSLVTAGRITVFILIIYIAYLFYHYYKTIPKKLKIMTIIVIFIVVVLLFIISNLREGYNRGKQVSSAYAYFSISLPLLTHWVDYVDANNIRTYGITLIYGIVEFVQWGLHILDISIPGIEWIREVVNAPQNSWVVVFTDPRGWYNAFCSAIYYWYLDFGIIGAVLIPLGLGIISNNVFLKAVKNKNKKSLFYYLLIISLLIISFMRFQTITPTFFITIVIVALAVKRKRKTID